MSKDNKIILYVKMRKYERNDQEKIKKVKTEV